MAIALQDFMSVYCRMAPKHSAVEIGRALGLDGDDAKVSNYVSVRANQLRKSLKDAALARAQADGLDETATAELVDRVGSQIPKLPRKQRAKRAKAIVNLLDDVLARIDNESESE